jgi:hypothetical protein
MVDFFSYCLESNFLFVYERSRKVKDMGEQDPLQSILDWRISISWLGFILKNSTAKNEPLVPLVKNNNKILFYIKKINH